jgi:hypothetical protein
VINQPDDVWIFIDELQTSQTLYGRIRSLNAGRTAVKFKPDGAPVAVAAAYASCPIKPPEPAKPAKHAKPKQRS